MSGPTWALLGLELDAPCLTPAARQAGFTNEGGFGGRYRFLKSIMGLWMIQSVRHELGDRFSYPQLCAMADEAGAFPGRVDVNDGAFFAPDSMIEAVRSACRSSGQPVPRTPGELAAVIYRSLADAYARALDEIEALTGRKISAVRIVGGGANADYLNALTAAASGRTVLAGPSEATAIGNLAVQMLGHGVFRDGEEARACIRRSFPVQAFP